MDFKKLEVSMLRFDLEKVITDTKIKRVVKADFSTEILYIFCYVFEIKY